MSIVTVRVDEETKRKMAKLRHINWSGVLRDAIGMRLAKEEGRNLARAILANDELRKEAPRGWDATSTIRYWREHRYGRTRD